MNEKTLNEKYPFTMDAIRYFFKGNRDDDNLFHAGFWKQGYTNNRKADDKIHIKVNQILLENEFLISNLLESKNYSELATVIEDLELESMINNILEDRQ